MRNTVLEVSRKAFLNNYKTVLEHVGKNVLVMPVIKANCYGTYLNKDNILMNNFSIVAVSLVDEALQLRCDGYKNDIFVLNQPYINEIETIIDNNIIIGVSSSDFLEEIVSLNRNIRIHIEVETGMGRTGVSLNDLEYFLNKLSNTNIIVEGVYTHFASADIDHEFTIRQINLFNDAVFIVKKYFPNIKYIHCSASNGILNYDLGACNMVRPGLILYGYPASKSMISKINLEPVAKFKSKISFIKNIKAGDSISYGRSFVASGDMKVATVGCGYADGVKRSLSNKGFVSVKGKRCMIVGKICMDSFMIDVSNLSDVSVGDDVYLFDNCVVTLDEIALICETINYEILATIGERVPRVFVD